MRDLKCHRNGFFEARIGHIKIGENTEYQNKRNNGSNLHTSWQHENKTNLVWTYTTHAWRSTSETNTRLAGRNTDSRTKVVSEEEELSGNFESATKFQLSKRHKMAAVLRTIWHASYQMVLKLVKKTSCYILGFW